MRNDELALDYIERAELTLDESRGAFEKEVYSLTIEYPRDHDLSDVLLKIRKTRQLPDWFENKIDFMVSVSGDLARKRGPAFYGIERSVMPASKLFDREAGLKALRDAGEVFKLCVKLIKGN